MDLRLGRRSDPALVGLDIQPGFVAAVQARVNGSILAERAAALPLAADTVRDGEVVDEGALSEVLRELFKDSGMSKRVRIGVANQRTVLRTLELPALTDEKELAAAVRFQAQDQVPMPLNNAVLDFHPLGIVETPEGPRQRVVLVAAQRDMVERLLSAVRNAGLSPEGVDLSAFALIRSLHHPGSPEDERVLYLNVDGLTNLAIAEGRICRFTRVVGRPGGKSRPNSPCAVASPSPRRARCSQPSISTPPLQTLRRPSRRPSKRPPSSSPATRRRRSPSRRRRPRSTTASRPTRASPPSRASRWTPTSTKRAKRR